MNENQNQEQLEQTVRMDAARVVEAAREEPAPQHPEFELNMDDTQGLDLEDIMKEFASTPKKAKPEPVLEETRKIPVAEVQPEPEPEAEPEKQPEAEKEP